MLRSAGRPERAVPAVIVAGTNGKGSTSACLASILTESGLRTGLYTSPHLVRLEERWRIDGADVTSRELRDAIRTLRENSKRSGVVPTYFEAVTLLAFILFDARRCDVAVLEVGMGGRLDATNVVRPVASLIAPVALDHMEYLGRTIRAVSREKAGVIHRGAIALTSSTDPVAIEVIAKRVATIGAIGPHRVAEETRATSPRLVGGRSRFRLTTPRATYRVDVALPGAHQVSNVALAVRAAEELSQRFGTIDRASIERGLERAVWRGRLERFVIEGRDVWVDGAHNPAGAETVARFVETHLARPRTLVLGMLSDKDVEGVTAILAPSFDRVVVTAARSDRALPVSRLRRYVEASGGRVIAVRKNVASAIRAALDLSEVGPTVICGSLYVAGEAVATLDRLVGREPSCASQDHRE